MHFVSKKFGQSPITPRVAPFVAFVLLTFLQDQFGETTRYWIYLSKTGIAAWLLVLARPFVPEFKWAISGDAVLVGIGVCVLWIGLDPYYPHWGSTGTPWNPYIQFGSHSLMAWTFIIIRIVGTTLVVPPFEEIFYRSFIYRFLVQKDFLGINLGEFRPVPFLVTSLLFGLEHHQWLAGILTGMAYQLLVVRKNRLGDAITAHAVTNFLLGLWVVWRNAWNFW